MCEHRSIPHRHRRLCRVDTRRQNHIRVPMCTVQPHQHSHSDSRTIHTVPFVCTRRVSVSRSLVWWHNPLWPWTISVFTIQSATVESTRRVYFCVCFVPFRSHLFAKLSSLFVFVVVGVCIAAASCLSNRAFRTTSVGNTVSGCRWLGSEICRKPIHLTSQKCIQNAYTFEQIESQLISFRRSTTE